MIITLIFEIVSLKEVNWLKSHLTFTGYNFPFDVIMFAFHTAHCILYIYLTFTTLSGNYYEISTAKTLFYTIIEFTFIHIVVAYFHGTK